eukprot:TRINITY_DN26718_c0_g2_i1.p1 TRINITY_DN26718_c0_g2~~TRINITY_DN26718_c0_g2_i1.p1  ORF type:complete len:208 (-),score=31.77 TRINITY_DN26718_c0_g2_i1:112-735(-)
MSAHGQCLIPRASFRYFLALGTCVAACLCACHSPAFVGPSLVRATAHGLVQARAAGAKAKVAEAKGKLERAYKQAPFSAKEFDNLANRVSAYIDDVEKRGRELDQQILSHRAQAAARRVWADVLRQSGSRAQTLLDYDSAIGKQTHPELFYELEILASDYTKTDEDLDLDFSEELTSYLSKLSSEAGVKLCIRRQGGEFWRISSCRS